MNKKVIQDFSLLGQFARPHIGSSSRSDTCSNPSNRLAAYSGTRKNNCRYSSGQPELVEDAPHGRANSVQLANRDEVPLRLILGVDAEKRVQQAEARRASEAEKWRHLTISTVFENAESTPELLNH
jgi:hypothetical protein